MSDIVVSMMLLGALSNAGVMPFWATANQYGIMPETSGTMTWMQAASQFDGSKTLQWRWGVSAAVTQDDFALQRPNDFLHTVDELYASLRWKVLTLDVGFKHRPQDFMAASPALGSLSSIGGSLLWSGNSREMPGYRITLSPWSVPGTQGHLQLLGSWGDFSTTDTRFVQGCLVHAMQFALRLRFGGFSFTGGIDHAAQWAGVSRNPLVGRQPSGFGDYLRICIGATAGASGTASDRQNALGNHLGAIQLRFDYQGNGWQVTARHESPYEDRSGMRFQNFPDGVNTLAFRFDDKDRWVSDILYEFHYTKNQSGTVERFYLTPEQVEQYKDDPRLYRYSEAEPYGLIVGGGDDYSNNGEYKSGWTAYGRSVGNPLFFPTGTRAGTWSPVGETLGVENNRLLAHHFALSGKLFRKVPYKLLLTYSLNYGRYRGPYDPDVVPASRERPDYRDGTG
ncbi:MAG: hypothetical protein J5871_02330, partial [Bacteroidales bacterium]|nr:hypothetical protein [Bacteroidales bacterium]